MSDKSDVELNSEQTLITLEQLSQTLEVMTHVVDRLKQHLNRQMSLNAELFQDEEKLRKEEAAERLESSKKLQENYASFRNRSNVPLVRPNLLFREIIVYR